MNKIIISGEGHRDYGAEAIGMAIEVAHMARRDHELESARRIRAAVQKPKPRRHADGTKIGRNEICPFCKSGLKFKKCCGR